MPKLLQPLFDGVRRAPLQWGLAAAAVCAYALAFVPPYSSTDMGLIVLSAVPVLVASWLLGFWGGLAVALLTFPANALLLDLTGQGGWAVLQRPGTLQGSVLVLILGVVVGGLRDLAWQMQREHEARRATEAAARATDVRYRLVAESASDAILTLDSQSRIIYGNPATERVFGYRPHELEGRPLEVLLVADETGASGEDGVARYLRELPSDGRRSPLELTARRRDGERIEVEASFGASTRDGEAVYTVIARNVTERKQLEHDLRVARNDAVRANRAKSEFISRMSHELRTPLNAILGFAQLVETDALGADDRDSLVQIVKAGRHLLGLVDEVLDVARIEAGRLALSVETVELADVAAEAWDLIRPRAMERGIRADLSGVDGVPPVRADVQRLRQVLLNLFSNAVKYNREDGGVRVACSTTDGMARVEVADDGPGVPPEHVDRLFTPFDRLGAERSGIEGTGMGLSLSRSLVHAMGGEMAYDAGRAAFHFTLPLAETRNTAEAANAAPDEAAPNPSGEPRAVPRAETIALCIVRDSVQLTLLERLLERPGLRIVSAVQASLGLELAAQHAPALVVADADLPDLRDVELLRRLAGTSNGTRPTILIMARDLDAELERRLRESGADAVLPLPLDVAHFAETIDSLPLPGTEDVSA